MNEQKPNPGRGYVVRELIGRGRWKEVYRAVRRGEWHDRALAWFIRKPVSADELLNELKVLVLDRLEKRPEPENIAKVYGAFKGADGEIYLVEELLYRPLEALAPLKVVDRFLQIARDLSNGLASLHEIRLVHRDLKLDNCGIDHAGNAKIFDLGSATSEGGNLQGTTLSRAPELFAKDAKCTKEGDVWALGALLFALRTGEYPFVTAGEARTRPDPGDKVARAHFDEEIAKRSKEPGAKSRLRSKVEQHFPAGTREILLDMLSFDPGKRPTARKVTDRWSELLRVWAAVARAPVPTEAGVAPDLHTEVAKDLIAYLGAVLLGNAGMSTLQWERVSKAIDEIESKARIDVTLIQNVKQLREKVNALRATEVVG